MSQLGIDRRGLADEQGVANLQFGCLLRVDERRVSYAQEPAVGDAQRCSDGLQTRAHPNWRRVLCSGQILRAMDMKLDSLHEQWRCRPHHPGFRVASDIRTVELHYRAESLTGSNRQCLA